MDLFQTTSRLSVMSIIFGGLTLAIGWLIYVVKDPVNQLALGEAALVFLVLFFYSLAMDKMEEIEEKIKIVSSGRKKPAKLVP